MSTTECEHIRELRRLDAAWRVAPDWDAYTKALPEMQRVSREHDAECREDQS